MARPTKFTPERLENLASALESGKSLRQALKLVGISRSCFYTTLFQKKYRDIVWKLKKCRVIGDRKKLICSAIKIGCSTVADIEDETGLAQWTIRQTLVYLVSEKRVEERPGQPCLYFLIGD